MYWEGMAIIFIIWLVFMIWYQRKLDKKLNQRDELQELQEQIDNVDRELEE